MILVDVDLRRTSAGHGAPLANVGIVPKARTTPAVNPTNARVFMTSQIRTLFIVCKRGQSRKMSQWVMSCPQIGSMGGL